MTTGGYNNYNSLIISTLYIILVFNKCRKDFFCEVVILLLSIKGRVNFFQLGRFGNFKALKRNIRLEHVNYSSAKGKLIRKLYFSTDTQMDALKIMNCYQSRFQIEFLYRAAKQHTGLNDSQARSENKLNFQFPRNFGAAITAINIAKVEHWLSQPIELRKPFSMADIKTMNHNRLLLQRFIDVFGVNAYSAKNRNHVFELIYYDTIAA